MFLSKAMRFVIKAAYAKRKIFEKRQKIISIICHHTKSDLFFFMTEIAMQVADKKEKIFPRIRLNIKPTSFLCIISYLNKKDKLNSPIICGF